jgi:hypothetical protein
MARGGGKRRTYARDNRGRFASTGATARGGRLKTAAGNKRKTVTARMAPAKAAGTIGKRKGLKARPVAAEPKQVARPSTRPTTKATVRKGLQTVYKAFNALDNTHNNKTGSNLRRLPYGKQDAKRERIEKRLQSRRSSLEGQNDKLKRDQLAAEYKQLRKKDKATARKIFKYRGKTRRGLYALSGP